MKSVCTFLNIHHEIISHHEISEANEQAKMTSYTYYYNYPQYVANNYFRHLFFGQDDRGPGPLQFYSVKIIVRDLLGV